MDGLRFSRASLINIGFLYAANLYSKFGHMVMHNIDLLQVNTQLKNGLPKKGQAYHLASPKLHPKYHYDKFVGGIVIVTFDDFWHLNGLDAGAGVLRMMVHDHLLLSLAFPPYAECCC